MIFKIPYSTHSGVVLRQMPQKWSVNTGPDVSPIEEDLTHCHCNNDTFSMIYDFTFRDEDFVWQGTVDDRINEQSFKHFVKK